MASDKPGLRKSDSWKPVLGIGDPAEGASARGDWREPVAKAALGTVFDQPEPEELIELTVIVPARNEEDCLGNCLHSLVSQSERSSHWARIGIWLSWTTAPPTGPPRLRAALPG